MNIMIGLLASALGFSIAIYIHERHSKRRPLRCPRRAPCETVLGSPQAKTFGISNSVLGIAYYALIFFLLFFVSPGKVSAYSVILFLLITAGFLFSLYLVRVQRVVIKQWCIWCLGSAITSTILFLVGVTFFL
jgi:uncharacterized membrane protein